MKDDRASGLTEFEEARRAEHDKIRLALGEPDSHQGRFSAYATPEFWERRQAEFEKYAHCADLVAHWSAERGWVLWWGESAKQVPEACQSSFSSLTLKALGGVPKLLALPAEPWQVWLEFLRYHGGQFEVTTIIPGDTRRLWNPEVENGRTVWKFRDEVHYATDEPRRWGYGILLKRVFEASALFCLKLSATGSATSLLSQVEIQSPSASTGNSETVCATSIDRTNPGLAAGGDSIPPRTTSSSSSSRVFRKRGDFWSLKFDGDGTPVSVRDRVGMAYIAQLLRCPDRSISCLELQSPLGVNSSAGQKLARDESGEISTETSRHEILDAKAWREYSERLEEIRIDLQEAMKNNDRGRIETLKWEMHAIEDELQAVTNVRGRPREFPTREETARKAVCAAIRNAMNTIGKYHVPLSEHLRIKINLGTSCRYNGDDTDWEL